MTAVQCRTCGSREVDIREPSPSPMTDGEKMIWAASFSAALMNGSRPALAAVVAALHVMGLRSVKAGDVEAICAASTATLARLGDQPQTMAMVSVMREDSEL